MHNHFKHKEKVYVKIHISMKQLAYIKLQVQNYTVLCKSQSSQGTKIHLQRVAKNLVLRHFCHEMTKKMKSLSS